MRLVIAISGPVAVGKSEFIGELQRRYGAVRISTRELIQSLRSVPSERRALQEAGEALDHETDGKWVADALASRASDLAGAIVIIDSVRIAKQIEHLRAAFGETLQHVHLTASVEVLSGRFLARKEKGGLAVSEFSTYDEVRANPTESAIERLGSIANHRLETDLLEPGSVATLAAERLGLLSKT